MVKIVETKTKASGKRSKIQLQHHPLTKKKLKQITLLDAFAKSPRVLVSHLRLPLYVLKNNLPGRLPSVNLQSKCDSKVKGIKAVDTTKSKPVKNENKSLPTGNGTTAIIKKQVRKKIIYTKPEPKLVCLPKGLENSDFGEALFICQFLVDFSNALKIPVTLEISTDNLIKALANGFGGFEYISSILLIFIKAISSDMDKTVELGVKLSNVAVTSYSAPEVARLFLINANSIAYNKKIKEFQELEPRALLEVLSCLCEMALECRVVRSYVEQIVEQRANFYRQRPSMSILEKELEAKTQLLQEKDQSNATDQDSTEKQESPQEITTLSTNSFYGSLRSKNQRQLMAEKLRREKAQAELEKQKKYKEEKEIAKMELTLNKYTTDMKIVCYDYKNLLRFNPIGTDRDDNRYWWFSHNSPHLVVEKKWQFNESSTLSDWYTFDSSQYSQLCKALEKQIANERSLKTILKNKIDEISKLKTGTEKPTNDLVMETDWNVKSIQSLKDEMKNLLDSIFEEMLGWMLDFDNWRKRLSHAENLLQMRSLLMDMYKCLHGSCVKKICQRFPLEKWVAEVEKCDGVPRMHFLVAVLKAYLTSKDVKDLDELSSAESSVSDNENSEDDEQKGEKLLHLKCSRCKRGEGDLFECIKCSTAFHLTCYKPKLRHPPRAWVCEKCKRRKTLPVNEPTITVNAKSNVKKSNEERRRKSPRNRE